MCSWRYFTPDDRLLHGLCVQCRRCRHGGFGGFRDAWPPKTSNLISSSSISTSNTVQLLFQVPAAWDCPLHALHASVIALALICDVSQNIARTGTTLYCPNDVR